MKTWACFLGWHTWWEAAPRVRICLWCERREELRFYSNRTQEWVKNGTATAEAETSSGAW